MQPNVTLPRGVAPPRVPLPAQETMLMVVYPRDTEETILQTIRIVEAIREVHDHRRATLPGTGMAVFAFPCAQLL